MSDASEGAIDRQFDDSPCPVRWTRAPARTYTFESDPMRAFAERHLQGRVLNLFAGTTKLQHSGEVVRNDLDEAIDADYHFDAIEVRDYFDDATFDTVILDPPFSVCQSRKRYNGEYAGHFKHVRDEVRHVVRPGGMTITYGYHSTGMGKTRGFEKVEIVMFCHGGRFPDTISVAESDGDDHDEPRDTIGVAERRVETGLSQFVEAQ